MIIKSIFYNLYFYIIGLYHIYISRYFTNMYILINYKKNEISSWRYFTLIFLCAIKSLVHKNKILNFLDKSVMSKSIVDKLICTIEQYDKKYDYYIEYFHNNKKVKGIYTNNGLYDIIKNINDAHEYFNSKDVFTKSFINISINNTDGNIISIKSILNEYIFNSLLGDILKFENVYYDEHSILHMVSIELLKKKEHTVDFMSVHNENKMKIYSIE